MTKQLTYSNTDRNWTAAVIVKSRRTIATVTDLTTGEVFNCESRYLDSILNVIERQLWIKRGN